MKMQHLLIALTAANFGLLLFLLSKAGVVEAAGTQSMLKGSGLQIVDDEGRIRASLSIEPAGTTEKGEAYPETVLLRLIAGNGQPSVKISTSNTASGVSLVGGDDESYVILQADGPESSLKMAGPDGRQQVVKP